MALTNEQKQKLHELISDGTLKNGEIAKIVGCSEAHVSNTKRRSKIEGKKDTESLAWLKEHWNWDIDKAQDLYTGKKRTKYRVVKKGTIGRLRTPYRPDRIFR